MSREFIDAIASGNNLEAEDEFKNSISSKVGDALEFRRKEISQTFAGNNELVEEDSKPYVKQKPDGTWCVYDAEGNIVSEHESEDEAKAALSNKKEDDEVDEAWVSIGKAAGPAPSSQRRATADDPKPYIRTKPMARPWRLDKKPAPLGRVNREYMKKHPKAAASRANEESDLDEAGWVNLARELEPGGRLSKEKDTGKGWQNLNKLLAKKDKDDGKGWQNLNKLLVKKDGVPRPDAGPTGDIGKLPRPDAGPTGDIGKLPRPGPRLSPGALGGKTKPGPRLSPGALGGKTKPGPRLSPGALGGKVKVTPMPPQLDPSGRMGAPKPVRRSPGALGGKTKPMTKKQSAVAYDT